MNYTPAILPKDADGLVRFLASELPRIADAINEKSKRLWYASAILTPTQLTLSTNDWAPAGLAGALVVRISASGAINLTGIKNPETGTPRLLFLTNIGTQTITLKHGSASSVAANRFALPAAADRLLTQNAGALLQYDITDSVWRLLALAL